jgi:uncharacterized protein
MTEQATATLKRSSDANVELVRQLTNGFNSRDAQAVAPLLTDDVEWHEIGRAEPIIGKEALAARFTGALPEWEISVDTHDILANDEHAIALVTANATVNGKSLTYRTAEIYHVRDGKISARWAFSDDTAAINEFFAGT